jgi:hypothetical protein
MGYPLTPLKGLNRMRRVVAPDDAVPSQADRAFDAASPTRPLAEVTQVNEKPALPDARHKSVADQIILAGKRRRNEIPDDPLPEDSAAAAILNAGKRARGELP